MVESPSGADQDSPETLRHRLQKAEEALLAERAKFARHIKQIAFGGFIAAALAAVGVWIGNNERIQIQLLQLRSLSEKKRADKCENDLDEELAREKRLLEMINRQYALIEKYQRR